MALLLCLTIVGAAGCGAGPGGGLARFSYTQIHMGVETKVILYAPDERSARDAAGAAFARIAVLDGVMSDYRQDSEIMQLCAGPAGVWTPVSGDLFRVLTRAREISERTGGAFDCTVGPLSVLWREARRNRLLPAASDMEVARRSVGWRLVELEARTESVRLGTVGMRIDLGGIGKGFAADEALSAIRGRGISCCLIALAGDIRAGDPPPGQSAWRVAVETGYGSGPHPTVELVNAGVSTSGDTEQFVEIGGDRYSHILDPSTGLGLTTRAAATVIAPASTDSDALASAVCVLGPDRAAAVLSKAQGVGVRMIVDGREYRFGPREGLIRAGEGPESDPHDGGFDDAPPRVP